MSGLAGIATALAGIGAAQAIAGWMLAARFAATPVAPPTACPPMTVLKPLHGDEPLLEQALASVCAQDYPRFQIVFGVQRPSDPAIAVVRQLEARFPQCDITLIVNPTLHGENHKVSNLINMLPAAKHDVLVIADSDVHVQPDYLQRLAAAIEEPDVGLVTTLYGALPATTTIPAQLGGIQIAHGFLPGALLARALGRQDCLGATMCLQRQTLARIGGLPALVDHLADDNVLGRLVVAQGLKIRLADTVPATTVPETGLPALFSHELRWARTIRALVPIQFVGTALQYPLAWAAIAVLLSGGAVWSVGAFGIVWVLRALAATGIDRAMAPKLSGLAFCCPVWLLPLRDGLSFAILLASYAGRRVEWRGHRLQADTPAPPETRSNPLRPAEGLTQR